MSKKILAVFDSDIGYVDRFLRFVKSKRSLPLKAVGFSSLSSLELFLERNPVDILLLSEALLTDAAVEKLYENAAVSEILLSGDQEELSTHRKQINKYRPAEALLADIIRICRLDYEEDLTSVSFVPGILGVYSPSCCMERQEFSLAVARVLSVNRPVLYLNFDRFSGMRKKMLPSGENTISDLIYYFKTNQKKFRECLGKAIIKQGSYDLLLAPFDQEDLDLIEEEEWKTFLNLLAECGSYEVIVLDMAEAFRKPELIFSICERVYIPGLCTPKARDRMEELRFYLTEKEGEPFLARITEVELSEEDCASSQEPAVSDRILEKAEQACFGQERRTA